MKPIPSPCNSICRIHEETGWCLGCARTRDEIAAWPTLDGGARRMVWKRLPPRRIELARRLASAAGYEQTGHEQERRS